MTTRSDRASWRTELAAWVLVSVLTTTAFWIGVGAATGVIVGVWMTTLTVAVHVGRRRSDAIRVVGGAGDERTRDLYVRATAAAGTVLWAVVTGWWLLCVVRGEQNGTLLVLVLVFAGAFFGSAAVLARRS